MTSSVVNNIHDFLHYLPLEDSKKMDSQKVRAPHGESLSYGNSDHPDDASENLSGVQPEMYGNLPNVHDGLELLMATGCLFLDRPTFIRRLSTATIRGMCGHALKDFNPIAFDRFFKPSPHEDIPPAYLFQPMDTGGRKQDSLRFRVVSWDPEGEWIEALQQALWMAKGMPFGNSGARVRNVDWGEMHRIRFSGTEWDGKRNLELSMVTPLQLRIRGTVKNAKNLTHGNVIHACLNRLNLLSRHYGNGLQLPLEPLLKDALDCRELDRRLRDVNPARLSCTQNRKISLGGVVGSMLLAGVSKRLADLLSIAEILHIGRHTPEGCGWVRLQPIPEEAGHDG